MMSAPKHGHSRYCKGCWAHMHFPTPLRGPLSLPFRSVGTSVSRMNPNICTMCEKSFSRIMKAKQVEIEGTILFADIRGYTALTEQLEATKVSEMVSAFYDECAAAIWHHDGIINKAMGDGLLAIFNFPIPVPDHPRAAVLSAIELQRNCARRKRELATEFGIGIGIASGKTAVGEFGAAHTEFTAIGSIVNLAARLQQSANAGEVVLSDDVHKAAGEPARSAIERSFQLKGFANPVRGWTMTQGDLLA